MAPSINLLRQSLLLSSSSTAARRVAASPLASSLAARTSIRSASTSGEVPPWKRHEVSWDDWSTSTNPDFSDKKYPPKAGVEADPQLFGYPELPTEYTMLRDPRKGWWDQNERRNFGEVIQAEDEFLGQHGPEIIHGAPMRYFFYGFGSIAAFMYGAYLYEDYVYEYPVQVDREFPYNGLFAARGGKEWDRQWVYKGIDPKDEFEGSSRDYYLGKLPGKDVA